MVRSFGMILCRRFGCDEMMTMTMMMMMNSVPVPVFSFCLPVVVMMNE